MCIIINIYNKINTNNKSTNENHLQNLCLINDIFNRIKYMSKRLNYVCKLYLYTTTMKINIKYY